MRMSAVKESDKTGALHQRPILLLLLLILLLAGIFISLPAASSAQETSAQVRLAPPNPDDYVGTEICSDCHFAEFQQLQKTAMAAILSDKYPIGQRGCEGCHGPGRSHSEAKKAGRREPAPGAPAVAEVNDFIYGFPANSPKENSARCLTCHQKDEPKHLFLRSRHLTAGVGCTTCHVSHLLAGGEVAKPVGALESSFTIPQRPEERVWLDNRLLRLKQPQLCYSCHREIEAQFQLPIRHRVNEGLVKCTDCHNAHGTLNVRELLGSETERSCYSCHVEKRGPFVYEHAPVRVEGCTSCHTPHGSINVHLLKRREERQLCLECHVAPQAVNVPHPKPVFQTSAECTRCHIAIHGSNYQSQFLR